MWTGPLSRGFRLPADRLVLIAEEEIFGPRSHREARPAQKSAGPGLGDLGEIAEGDAIVHDEHGIGRYRGLKKLTVRGVAQDFLHLEYDGGTVYVPVYRIGQCHRYSGGDTTTRPGAGSRDRVWVGGYRRADGSKVSGYYRSTP